MVKKTADTVVVTDKSGRRNFIREGAAFLLAGSAVTAAGSAFGDDCDHGAPAAGQKQAGNGSDSDSGDEADPIGCGKRSPVISKLRTKDPLPVGKIKA